MHSTYWWVSLTRTSIRLSQPALCFNFGPVLALLIISSAYMLLLAHAPRMACQMHPHMHMRPMSTCTYTCAVHSMHTLNTKSSGFSRLFIVLLAPLTPHACALTRHPCAAVVGGGTACPSAGSSWFGGTAAQASSVTQETFGAAPTGMLCFC